MDQIKTFSLKGAGNWVERVENYLETYNKLTLSLRGLDLSSYREPLKLYIYVSAKKIFIKLRCRFRLT